MPIYKIMFFVETDEALKPETVSRQVDKTMTDGQFKHRYTKPIAKADRRTFKRQDQRLLEVA